MRCPGCQSPLDSESHRCPSCGSVAPPKEKQQNRVAAIYAGILIGWAILFPFLVPIIIKISIAYS